MRGYKSRLVAFVLLLAFSQRMGASLWVHHLYHEAATPDTSGLLHLGVHCDCFDDAFMPLEGAPVFHLPEPQPAHEIPPGFVLSTLVHRTFLHSDLRGPPSAALFS